MNKHIRLRGRLLLFDVVDELNWKIPKDCDISYPKRVPFVRYITDYNNPSCVVSTAIISRDELGLICTVILNDPKSLDNYELPIGGIFVDPEYHYEDDIRVFDKFHIYGVGVTNDPAHKDYKLSLVEGSEV